MKKVKILLIEEKENKPKWDLVKLFKEQAHPSWHTPNILKHLTSNKAKKLESFLNNNTNTIYPPQEKVFSTFRLNINDIKVCIVGQDCYINENQAMGMSFSVPNTTKTPPSLQNIFKELKSDTGINCISPDLTTWLEQGVFLLNATLTVDAGNSNSHAGKGWEKFTDTIIYEISKINKNCVFILWGNFAQSKQPLIYNENKRHCIICSAHPSPLSAHRGFWNSKPFSITNNYLNAHGKTPINWQT